MMEKGRKDYINLANLYPPYFFFLKKKKTTKGFSFATKKRERLLPIPIVKEKLEVIREGGKVQKCNVEKKKKNLPPSFSPFPYSRSFQ